VAKRSITAVIEYKGLKDDDPLNVLEGLPFEDDFESDENGNVKGGWAKYALTVALGAVADRDNKLKRITLDFS